MKKYISILFFISGIIFAQQEQKSIELPDFVITGRQSIEVQAAQKRKPDLISTLSQDFFTPQYSPEELPLMLTSEPKKIVPSITAGDDYFSGLLSVGAGRYTLPMGNLSLSKSFSNFLISANVWGSNIKEYIPNAGYNTSGLSLSNNIFFDTDSGLLAGTNIKLAGAYWRDSYKFFASPIPLFERKTNRGNAGLSILNNYERKFNFSLNLNADFLTIVESDISERKLAVDGGFNLKISNLTIGAIGKYQKQILNNNLSGIDDYGFYLVNGMLKISPSKTFNLVIGAEIAGNSVNTFFSPFGLMQFQLDKGLFFNMEFKPHAENYTLLNFIDQNLYIVNGFTDNIFSEVKIDLKSSINYEFDKIFTIALWGNYSSTDNFLYFEDYLAKGFFDVRSALDVKSISAGLNVLIHPNQLGYFSGELKFQDIRDVNDNYIPYRPNFITNLTYGIDFDFGIGLKFKYRFAYDTYTDILNSAKLSAYHNLSAGFSYKLLNNLSLTADFQNILNRSNFVFGGYQEKLFDVILGAVYRW
ncbi:MAG: hypothetical protein RDU14_01145 [Melioribacteraceae bacterium]|nr:hypothetical protein [Melioribacteraceae bacterium]